MSRKGSRKMENDDKLPRGHAYIRMRNRGYKIDIDYPELDSAQAERIIKAVMLIAREDFTDEAATATTRESE